MSSSTINLLSPTYSPLLRLSNRWTFHPTSSFLNTSWATSSITFYTTSSLISLVFGQGTHFFLAWGDRSEEVLLLCVVYSKDGNKWKEEKKESINMKEIRLWIEKSQPAEIYLGEEGEKKVVLFVAEWGTEVELIGLYIRDESSLLLPPELLPSHRLLVIGDSISLAFTNLCLPEPQASLHPSFGAWESYPLVAKRLLESEGLEVKTEVIAVPGITLVHFDTTDEGGGEDSRGMEKRFWDDEELSRREGEQGPDTIVVALGTNDRGWAVGDEKFMKQFEEFLGKLEEHYRENLHNIVIVPPFPTLASAASAKHLPLDSYETLLQRLACSRSERNETKVSTHFWRISEVLKGEYQVDRLHPGRKGQEELGLELGRRLKELWGV